MTRDRHPSNNRFLHLLVYANVGLLMLGLSNKTLDNSEVSTRIAMAVEPLQRAINDITTNNGDSSNSEDQQGAVTPMLQRNFTTHAHKCEKVDLETIQYQAQSGEDKMLLTWFNGLCNGRYIELGGLDGKWLSNSYAFNHDIPGWKGVLIEASDKYYQLEKNRPNDVTIHAAVCEKPNTNVHWVTPGNRFPVAGIYEFAQEEFKQQFWKGINVEDLPTIQCLPLQALLDEHAPEIQFYDFLSLDIEGAEILALQSLDWDRTGFGMILIEADGSNIRKNLAVRSFMENQGYTFMMEHERSYWFYNHQFAEIYGHLL